MLNFYHKTNETCCRVITLNYTKSFGTAILTFDKDTRGLIYSLYAFLRYTDEIIDTFDIEQKAIFEEFRIETYKAIERRVSTNPVLDSFQSLVHTCNIELHLIESFFRSMAMDLDNVHYDDENYRIYIYGTAEILGLLCLKIVTRVNNEVFFSSSRSAQKMAAAFQKINILRDLKEDFVINGKCYVSHSLENGIFNDVSKAKIENDIKKDLLIASSGIKTLPKNSRLGALIAYNIYLLYFKRIKRKSSEELLNGRVKINRVEKICVLLISLFKIKLNY